MQKNVKRECSDWRADSEARFSCKTDINPCGYCESCVCTVSLRRSAQWIISAGHAAKTSFITGLLMRCRSAEILQNVQDVLQVTLGKDFTYARCNVKVNIPEVFRDRGDAGDTGLDTKPPVINMLDTWEWFSRSPSWTKSHYLLGLLSLCEPELLHGLGNLVRVLIAREKRGFLQFSAVSTADENDLSSLSESHHSFHTGDHPELDLLVQASSVYEPVSFPPEAQDKSASDIVQSYTKSTIQAVSLECEVRKGSDTDSDSSDDPALMVVPQSSKSMSGVSLHRDFIRGLPVNIAKRILGLLDMVTLHSCRRVSQHWCYLTKEILGEIKVKEMVEKQAMILQGSSSSGVNPAYARIREVPVPVREEEMLSSPINIPHKKKEDVMGLESVYTGVKTKAVEMEERNVFCGVFNILVLLDREDPSRVICYSGGQMVAVGSRDRAVRLLNMTLLKEVPPLMQGHAGSVRAVLVCEEKGLVISASYDLSIRCWNLKTGVCTMLLCGHMGTITCLDLHGDHLVSGSRDCRVKVWNLKSGQCCQRIRFRHRKPVVCVKIRGSVVLSGCEAGLVKMWDMETASLLKVITGHQGSVNCLFCDQWHILSGGSDGLVLAWSTNADFKTCLMTFHHPKQVLTLSFLFLRVITGCVDGKIRIFNFLSGDCLRVIKINTNQSAVLSLHTHDNNILVNSSSRVLLLQFAQERWDYSALSERKSGAALHGLICADRRAHSGLSTSKASRRDRRSRMQALTLHTRSFSAPSMQQAHTVQQEHVRQDELQAYRHSRSYTDLQPEFINKPHSAMSSRPFSGHSTDVQSLISHTPRSAASGSEKISTKYVMTPSERAVGEHVRKRGVHHPVTVPQLLLKVRPNQQPNTNDLATYNMKLNAGVRDAWGPPSTEPAKEPQTGVSPPPPPLKVPKRPYSAPRPSTQSTFKGMVKVYTPLRTHRADLNLQHSLHSGHIHSSIPTATVIHPQTELSSHDHPKCKATRPQTSCGVRKVGAFTTTAEGDFQNSQKMLMRSKIKHPGRRVDFEVPSKPRIVHNPLDPFRQRGGFKLKTDTELEELVEAQAQLFQSSENKEKQRKQAWKLKMKGLLSNDYMKKDQVYAPELGEDTYI